MGITKQLGSVEKNAIAARDELKTLSLPRGVNLSLARTEARLKAIADQSTMASRAITTSFAGMDGSIATTAAALAGLRGQMAGLAQTAPLALPGGGSGRHPRPTGHGAGGPSLGGNVHLP